jgi:hypothetical protein
MANVGQTVRQVILCHPDKFVHRTSVLHHLLCEITDQWRWVKGEIVPSRFATPLVPWTAQKEEEEIRNLFAVETSHEISDDVFHEKLAQVRQRQEQLVAIVSVDERVHQQGEILGKLYPQSKYCLLLNVPVNVKPDWSEAVREMRSYVISRGWTF